MKQSIKNRILLVIVLIIFIQLLSVFIYFHVLKEQLRTSWLENKGAITRILADRFKEDIIATQIKIKSITTKYRSLNVNLKEILWRLTGDIEHIEGCAYYDTKGKLIYLETRFINFEGLPQMLSKLGWTDEVLGMYSGNADEKYMLLKVFDINSNVPMGFIVCSMNLKDLLKDYTHQYGIHNATIRLADTNGQTILLLNNQASGKALNFQTHIRDTDMLIELSEPEDFVYENAYDFLKASLLLNLVLCSGLLLIGFFTVKRIFKPLEDLKLSVMSYAGGKNLEIDGYGEVYVLAKAFQELLDKIEKEKSVYVNLFNKLGDALVLVEDEMGTIEMVNENFLKMFDIMPSEVLKMDIKNLSEHFTTGSFLFIPEITVSVSGKTKCVSVTSIPLELEDKNYTLFHIKDITERKNLEILVGWYSKLAMAGEMACSLAHQLNNPLASIMAYAEYIRNVSNEKEVKEMAEVVLKNVERAKNTISRLLYMAKSYDGAPQEMNPVNFTKDLLDIINLKAKHKKVIVELNAKTKRPKILTYPWKLEQVLINLIDNAIDASPVQGKVYVNIEDANSFIVWKIKDEGPGVDSEDIFQPFYTKKDRGFGLGLSIAKRFVEDIGGRIEYENLDKGCEFRVYIKSGDA